jgi:hypothetical protein
MNRSQTVIVAVLAVLALGLFFWFGQSSQRPAPKATVPNVPQLHGTVTAANFARFEEFVSKHADRIIGLQVSFDQTSDSDPLSVSTSGSQFVARLRKGTSEVVANSGYSLQNGKYVFNGFFLVKSGGFQQGVVSYGLVRTKDEAAFLRGVVVRKEELP